MGPLRRFAALTLAALVLPLAACGDDDEPVTLVEGVTVEVQAVDNTFRPGVEVAAGTEVVWTNDGRTDHDIRMVDGDDFGVDRADFAPGDEYSYRFTEPGSYAYYCTLHGTESAGMTGSVEVTEGGGVAPAPPGPPIRRTARPAPARSSASPTTTRRSRPRSTPPAQVTWSWSGPVSTTRRSTSRPTASIRGTDRNEVILDGEFELDNGIRVLGADGVVVENMTARNYATNGFFWTGVDGYRGSFLTAYRNGDYGIYAFDSVNGQFNDSCTSGSPDAGFYIGQCYPCNAVIANVTSEYNGLGYSGTNAGGDLYIIDSVFRFNRAGIVPNSGSYGSAIPSESTLADVVYANNQPDTPAIEVALLAMGNGILVAGGHRNLIVNNLVIDHDRTGIGLVPFPEEDPSDDVPTGDELDLPCAERVSCPSPSRAPSPTCSCGTPRTTRSGGNVVRDSASPTSPSPRSKAPTGSATASATTSS